MPKDDDKLFGDFDDGSSLEKRIETLDKNDPLYEEKRARLFARLKAFKEKLKVTDKKITRQLALVQHTFKELHMLYEKMPYDKDLSKAVETVSLDADFLKRAKIELFALKQDYNKQKSRLSASQQFNQPLSLSVATDIKIKPLPSYRISFYEQQQSQKKEKRPPVRSFPQPPFYQGRASAFSR